MKNASLVLTTTLFLTVGCSGMSSSKGGGAPSGADVGGTASTGTGVPSGSSTGTGTGMSTGSSSSPAGTAGEGTAGTTGVLPSQTTGTEGQLTAGTWDDNLNFDFYETYLARMDASQLPGLPLIERTNRLAIKVVDGMGAPLAGARVTVSDTGGKLFEAPTRGDGALFFFPGTVGAAPGTAVTIAVSAGQTSGTATAHVGDAAIDIVLTEARATPVATLDLALVVDTTGSMGDELQYLKVEMSAIIARVARDYPNVSQRWAAIFYRDTVDEYVVRPFDFTTSVDTLVSEIAAQSAAGGGDIPEAPEQALSRLTTLSWRQDSVARMAFWVADAPHHAADARTMAQDILIAHGLGIRLYPISASGTDDLLEYTMRAAAEVTGGRYLFLTNDSGIGNDHKEPTIPCYVVTTLDKAMSRMIDMELLGTDRQPAPADILRTSGNPQNGTCKLAGDQTVTVL